MCQAQLRYSKTSRCKNALSRLSSKIMQSRSVSFLYVLHPSTCNWSPLPVLLAVATVMGLWHLLHCTGLLHLLGFHCTHLLELLSLGLPCLALSCVGGLELLQLLLPGSQGLRCIAGGLLLLRQLHLEVVNQVLSRQPQAWLCQQQSQTHPAGICAAKAISRLMVVRKAGNRRQQQQDRQYPSWTGLQLIQRLPVVKTGPTISCLKRWRRQPSPAAAACRPPAQ